jgi:hypothetical protein
MMLSQLLMYLCYEHLLLWICAGSPPMPSKTAPAGFFCLRACSSGASGLPITNTITGLLWLPFMRPEVLAAVEALAAAAEALLLLPASCVILDARLPTASEEQDSVRLFDLVQRLSECCRRRAEPACLCNLLLVLTGIVIN